MRQDGVVSAAQCLAAGMTASNVKRLCRNRQWLRVRWGVYLVDADLWGGEPSRPALIRAALLTTGPHAVAVLSSAAELHGIAGLAEESTVHISLPSGLERSQRTTDRDLRIHRFELRPADLMDVRGMRVTTPIRTVADLLLTVDRYTGVCLLDSGLNGRHISTDDLDSIRSLMFGRRGAVAARPWVAEADGRAQSPLETRVRLRCVDGGVPPDSLQFPVYGLYGELLAIADLAWEEARVIAEADGKDAHDNPRAVFRDRFRQNDIVKAGFFPLRFTWRDTVPQRYVPFEVRAAIARARTLVDPIDHDIWAPNTPPIPS
jgi:hypothetical protein